MIGRLWAVVADKHTARLGALILATLPLVAGAASAQTWSEWRDRPSLLEIVAIDETAEAGWPFGSEDLAGDGAQTFAADEAAIDLRSVYADVRAGKLWLRAYVAGTAAPTMSAVLFVFVDTDARSSTGGAAEGAVLWPAFSADPSAGGYERAVGLRGDGSSAGVYFWDARSSAWIEQPERPQRATADTGVARDPLRFAGDDHAYLQLELDLQTLALDDACRGTFFVRLWNDAPGPRSFGDVAEVFPCRARVNASGDPEVLKSATCKDDASCPAQGRCQDGACAIRYECGASADCRSDERCDNRVCVQSEGRTCDRASDCESLVCAGERCIACLNTGPRACASGLVCTPRGDCVRPQGTGGGSGSGGSAADGGEQVRGGAFTCSAGLIPSAAGGGATWLVLGYFAWVGRARMRKLRGRGER